MANPGMKQNEDIIEQGLGMKSQRRILRILASSPERGFTRYALMKQTYLDYVECRRALNLLVDLGWVRRHEGKTNTYQINEANSTVAALMEFYRKIGYLT